MTSPSKPSEPRSYKLPSLRWVALLVPFCIICLALILVAAERLYPRLPPEPTRPNPNGATQLQEMPPDRSFWEKLLSSDRKDPSSGTNQQQRDQWTKFWQQLKQRNQRIRTSRGSAKKPNKNANGKPGRGPSQIAAVVNDDHLALRQLVLAEAIIRYREGTNPGGTHRVKTSAANGPYRQQEEDRYEMERGWLLYHDGDATQKDLADMASVTNRMIGSPYVSFEDYASAGIANALNGQPEIAMALLSQAMSIWPAKDRMRGDIYLFLMCMAGITGNDMTFANMLQHFKENYPDWLYVETYLPHLKRLKRIYPDTAILDVVHGHVMTIVHNHGEAKRSYDAALASGKLSPDLKRMVTTSRRMLIKPEDKPQ